ncbi:MAG: hypothetical protein ACI915_001077 [Gammaproteobacteria bacterium]|jgi:hypothetical protein
MINTNHAVIVSADLRSYFQDEVQNALETQSVMVEKTTCVYVVNLLTAFVHAGKLFEEDGDGRHVKPLALHYADALNAESLAERSIALRKLGDIALFVAGLFADSLNHKIVDIDYYIAMGGSAYGYVHDLASSRARNSENQRTFGELAENFSRLVDVLGEVSEHSNLRSNGDLLRLYDIWLKTGSARAFNKLRRLGLTPSSNYNCSVTH